MVTSLTLVLLILFYKRSLLMGVEKDPSNISAAIQDRDKIPTATPIFSGSSNSMAISPIMNDVTGSLKSKMAAAKQEVVISQVVH